MKLITSVCTHVPFPCQQLSWGAILFLLPSFEACGKQSNKLGINNKHSKRQPPHHGTYAQPAMKDFLIHPDDKPFTKFIGYEKDYQLSYDYQEPKKSYAEMIGHIMPGGLHMSDEGEKYHSPSNGDDHTFPQIFKNINVVPGPGHTYMLCDVILFYH